jgi:tRNA pseudouridine55 synthase
MDGFLVVDKPAGKTSHDIVNFIRRLTGQKKAGHTGTLDPFATGVLPIALGEATKAIPFLDEGRKEYRAVMKLGESTDTQDFTGNIVDVGEWRSVTQDLLNLVFIKYTGRIRQLPPMYSAVKRNGVPLYKLARKGSEVAREARDAEIIKLEIEKESMPEVAFRVTCSRGTYIRTLAHDMGKDLGCGAHLLSLQRLASGPFDLSNALTLENLTSLASDGALGEKVISPLEALGHLVMLQVNETGVKRLTNGISPQWDDFVSPPGFIDPGSLVRISNPRRLIAVARVVGDRENPFKLLRVFN